MQPVAQAAQRVFVNAHLLAWLGHAQHNALQLDAPHHLRRRGGRTAQKLSLIHI